METFPLEICGRIVREIVSRGSKSEHPAVLLETQGGERLILRRRGGPAFGDRTFDDLVGQSIVAKGQRTGQTLIVGSWSSCEKSD